MEPVLNVEQARAMKHGDHAGGYSVSGVFEKWASEADCDGFNVAYVTNPGSFEDVVELLRQELVIWIMIFLVGRVGRICWGRSFGEIILMG
jgi:hypothetical protein